MLNFKQKAIYSTSKNIKILALCYLNNFILEPPPPGGRKQEKKKKIGVLPRVLFLSFTSSFRPPLCSRETWAAAASLPSTPHAPASTAPPPPPPNPAFASARLGALVPRGIVRPSSHLRPRGLFCGISSVRAARGLGIQAHGVAARPHPGANPDLFSSFPRFVVVRGMRVWVQSFDLEVGGVGGVVVWVSGI